MAGSPGKPSLNAPAGAPVAPAAIGPAAEASNILIVDDMPEKLLVFTTVLEELNQNLVCVRSGKDALREVLQREFAVILLDVNMPEIDGFETASLIRGYKRSAHTPIIFITSYADEIQTARGYSLGAVDYILSPVVPHVLRSKVQVFVQLFAMQRQIQRQADAHSAFVAAETARRAAEANDRRSAFLSNASRVLNRSLQAEAVVRDLAGLIVPTLGIAAAVLRVVEDVEVAPVLVGWRDPEDATTLLQDTRLGELHPSLRSSFQRVLHDRARCDVEEAEFAAWRPAVFGPAGPAGDSWPTGAAVIVPLLNGDRLLGAVLVVAAQDGGGGFAVGWPVLDDLAAHAAAALDNARLHESLQREIVERRAAQEHLTEANRRKDEFLAMLSHELRNPLAPIRTALEVIRRIKSPEPKFAWAADIMARQLRQMTRLVDELLDVARISQGKIVLSREKVDLNSVITHSVEAVQAAVDMRRQTLKVTLFREPMWLHGDATRLSQIVANLLNNAIKYSENGTVIELGCEAEPDAAVIRVRDQGIGMDADLMAHVFDLFTQGRRGLDRSQGGLGVGLTLARRLAEMHGGGVEAFSEGEGKGSQFTVRLPGMSLVPSGEAPAAVPGPTAAGPCGRVLVVDDNSDAAESMASLLASEGHVVLTAGDGLEALRVTPDFDPDVVLLDIGLPLLDGYEVARRLRLLPGGRAPVLAALTGYGQREDRIAAEQAGFDHHFVKPVDPAELLAKIHAWLQSRARAATASGRS